VEGYGRSGDSAAAIIKEECNPKCLQTGGHGAVRGAKLCRVVSVPAEVILKTVPQPPVQDPPAPETVVP
jgi:hypothetical protein